MDLKEKNLLILGNGFDLNCGLKSSFSDYFKTNCKNIFDKYYNSYLYDKELAKKLLSENKDTINFWSLCLYIESTKASNNSFLNSNWADVEHFIYDFLKNKTEFVQLVKDAISIHDNAKLMRMNINNFYNNPYTFLPFIQHVKTDNPHKYLLDELHKFENDFKNYLKKQINIEYENNKRLFINNLQEKYGNSIDVINFNYTLLPFDLKLNSITNVHGRIDKDIIIGIDFNNNSKLDNDNYLFTKTYRCLLNQKERFKLPSNIDNVLFYGHSLSDADFSYFYSIFDMYNLYDGKLKLIFLYSNYGHNDNENSINYEDYVRSIFKLISKYSQRKLNENNLMHRLLLEGRVVIEKI